MNFYSRLFQFSISVIIQIIDDKKKKYIYMLVHYIYIIMIVIAFEKLCYRKPLF